MTNIALVGYTGFVGSNIYEQGKNKIVATYNSKNIEASYGTKPDILIYAGVRAEKYLANTNPKADFLHIRQAEENIHRIQPKKLILISTIDVFQKPVGVTEFSPIETENLQPYGANRYALETWVRENYPDTIILRLPGLFGKNLKKNFIFDYINVIPTALNQETFNRLVEYDSDLLQYYDLQETGFYKCKVLDSIAREELKEKLRALHFTALNFTDSRNIYQFYPLSRLWDDMQVALKNDIPLLHLATEPIATSDLYQYLTGNSFQNEILQKPIKYDFRTNYAKVFCGNESYLLSKEEVLKEVKAFIEKEGRHER